MSCYLGIDIGGTKSHAILASPDGRVLGFGAGGAGNPEGVGYEGLGRVLQEITHGALHSAGLSQAEIAGAGLGVAGYDWPSERSPTLDAIDRLKLDCPIEVVNDTVIGLLAGASEGWGVAVVAGTDENCWGRDRQGRIGRVTGNGGRMGEFGGAATIMWRAIQAVSRAWSQRGPQTALSEALLETTGAENTDRLLEGLALGWYGLDAGSAPLVVQVAEQGDPVAREILQWSGSELASLAIGVIRQLDLSEQEFEVVLVGSMFRENPILLETMQEKVRAHSPGARFVHLEAPPVIGGVLLGMETAGAQSWEVRELLIRNTQELAL